MVNYATTAIRLHSLSHQPFQAVSKAGGATIMAPSLPI
jgi:hypothetical protein